MGGRLNPVPVVGGVFSRQPFLGQQQTAPTQQTTVPTQQPPVTTPPPETRPKEGKPGRRLAWGRLKKLEAQELAQYLSEISDRMKKVGIPPGIVDQIKDKLGSFVATAPPTAEVEVTDEQAQQLEAAILSLETAEAQQPSGVSTALVVAGVGLGLLILFSLGD